MMLGEKGGLSGIGSGKGGEKKVLRLYLTAKLYNGRFFHDLVGGWRREPSNVKKAGQECPARREKMRIPNYPA